MIGGPSTPATSLSENVNLFQSLRVLQEGEADTELFQNSTSAFRSGKVYSGLNLKFMSKMIWLTLTIYVKDDFTVIIIMSSCMHLS